MAAVLELKAGRRTKILMLGALVDEMRGVVELNRGHPEMIKRQSYEVLSTSISECQSINYQN